MNEVIKHPAIEALRQEIDAIGLKVETGYTLADAMREGSRVIPQLNGEWLADDAACALSTAYIAAKARGFI